MVREGECWARLFSSLTRGPTFPSLPPSCRSSRSLHSLTSLVPRSSRSLRSLVSSPWLLSTFTSRKGSFMKVSIILGDRRERSEQREPRMGGNLSEWSRLGSCRSVSACVLRPFASPSLHSRAGPVRAEPGPAPAAGEGNGREGKRRNRRLTPASVTHGLSVGRSLTLRPSFHTVRAVGRALRAKRTGRKE